MRVRAPLVVTGPKQIYTFLPIFQEICEQQFHFVDDYGVPYSNIPYMVRYEDGRIMYGKTDKNGFTEVFITEKEEQLVFIFYKILRKLL